MNSIETNEIQKLNHWRPYSHYDMKQMRFLWLNLSKSLTGKQQIILKFLDNWI